jgi:hypothetical protein
MIERLTRKPLRADALANHVNRTPEEAVAQARALLARAREIPERTRPVALDARIRVVHGNELVATADRGFDEACSAFASWIDRQTP